MHSLRPDIHSRPASVPVTSSTPSNDDIEAIIQLATSSRPSPDGRPGPHRDTRTQLFVGNLPYRVRWQDLKDLFRKAGTVLRADVSLGPDNRSRGYGTVLLATAEDAGRAVDMFNGYSWQTRILEVRPDRLPPDFIESANNNHSNSTGSTGSGTGVSPFVGHGPAASVLPFSAPSVSAIMDEYEYVNSIFGSEPPPTAGGRNLFVGNLPFHCQWQDLKDLFRQAGTIIRADVALGQDGRSRGFGTVVFATEFDADRAVKMFNGYEYNGRPLKVHYDKFSQSSQPTTMPASPNLHATATAPGPSVSTPSFPAHTFASAHLSIPLGFPYEFGPPSGPSSPFDLYPPSLQPPRSGGLSAAVSSSLANLGAGPTSLPPVSTAAANEHMNDSPAPSELHVHHTRHHSHGSTQGHSHPHPGPIALPVPGPISLPPPLVSPLHHPLSSFSTGAGSGAGMGSGSGAGAGMHLTPHGLPPITPSMPPFSFAPEHMLGSPAGAAMSPGAFWAGGRANPFINPVVGAPVRGESEMGGGGGEQGGGDYFPSLAGAGDGGYFPPLGEGEGREELRSTGLLGLGLGASKLANEILRDGDLFGGMKSKQEQEREPDQEEQEIQWREEDAGGLVTGIEALRIGDGSDDSESKGEGKSGNGNGNGSEGEHKRGQGKENGNAGEAQGERHPRAGSAGMSKPPGMVLIHRPESDPVQARPRGEDITRTGVSTPARGHEEELGVVGVIGVGMSTNEQGLGIGA